VVDDTKVTLDIGWWHYVSGWWHIIVCSIMVWLITIVILCN